MKKYKFLLALSVLSLFNLTSMQAQEKGDLQVKVSNFEGIAGQVRIALYNSEDTYMGRGFMFLSQTVNESEITLYFKNVPYGSYTFSLYHDINANNQLDKNVLGIPKEDYAFSNNANGRFGPPAYDACVFEINESMTTQTINLN